jgi:type I restriction enzyme M protein
MSARRKSTDAKESPANFGCETKLWPAANKLRSNMEAAEYKHVVPGPIFLKHISDSIDEHRANLVADDGDYEGADPGDRGEFLAASMFWVPAEARWSILQANAKQPTIGRVIDDAMVAIERDNPKLKGVLPSDCTRPALDKHRLGGIIDLIATIGLGDRHNREKDILGWVYEYFLGRYARAAGKRGGEFYTPQCVAKLRIHMIVPNKGRVYGPCDGWCGLFVQSEKFIEAQSGELRDISIYGQESNATTSRLAIMNLAIRGIESESGREHADSFRNLQHPYLPADCVLAQTPFNESDWLRKDNDMRWQFGEGDIRRAISEADVDCIFAIPSQLFYTTLIPVCLWFLAIHKAANSKHGFRDRRKQTNFIDARKLGTLINRIQRELTDAALKKSHPLTTHGGEIKTRVNAKTSRASAFASPLPKLPRTATFSRYADAAEVEDDGDQFEEEMPPFFEELNPWKFGYKMQTNHSACSNCTAEHALP